jgi:uncharacterized damage-inducible protein DinB
MELTAATADLYVALAFRQILDVVDRLGDPRVNERPPGPETNTVAQLVTHCCGVSEFWLGCVGLGRPTTRDRDSEFTAVASVAQLHALIDAAQQQISADLRAFEAGQTTPGNAVRETLEGGDTSDVAIVLHLLEELFQHLGQMELTADALGAPPRSID